MVTCLSVAALAALTAVLPARAAGRLQREREQARQLAVQVGALDARIGGAVQQYAQATASLDAVRAQIHANRRLQTLARFQLAFARAQLQSRAVALYKGGDVTTLDALFSATDFQQLVDQLTLERRITDGDQQVLRTVVAAQRELRQRSLTLAADRRAGQRLVQQRQNGLASIRAELRRRTALLTGVKADIARLAAKQVKASPPPSDTVRPPSGASGGTDGGAGGQGAWWPLIKSAAAAQGVSARGMYRLMMIESGGSATAVGPGGYYGLFQFAPATWKGSWNPYRGASISDGAAQIRATALAIHLGHGHAWWDPSFSWAFGG